MIICPIRLLWLMGLNHFITYHHPSSQFINTHQPSTNTHHRNSSTPTNHQPTPIIAIHQHPTTTTHHP
nr:hypothetical protein [uncultured Prevotella sp.]